MPRSKKFRRARLIVIVLVLLLVAGLGAGGWFGVRTVRASYPQVSGSVPVPGLSGPVDVERDAHGIPQLYADSPEDLFRAQGYVHAQDRFWEMDVRRHITSGRLSEMFGKGQVDTDAFLRTMGWARVARAEYDTKLSATTKKYLQAYADGVNAWLAKHPGGSSASLEYTLLGAVNGSYTPEKWTPVDSVAWLKAMAWDLSGNMQDEIDRSLLSQDFTADQIKQLYPDYPYQRNGTILKTGTVSADGRYLPPGTAAGTGTGTGTGSATGSAGTAPGAAPTGTAGQGASGPGTSATGTSASGAASRTPRTRTTQARAEVSGLLTSLSGTADRLPQLLGPAGQGIGSNSWVVSGKRTTTGKPLMANDPHLGPGMPSVWYQMGLHCRSVDASCPFDTAGFTFSGMPGVVIGHNQSISWGFTNLGPDVTDLYLEKITGPGTYLYDGRDRPFTVRREVIKVAGGKDVEITVRETNNGPLISDQSESDQKVGKYAPVGDAAPDRGVTGYGVALKWTALTPSNTMDAVFELDRAQDFAQFRAAAKDFAVPAQNLVYADTRGNIGYQAPGLVPIRAKGFDGTYPAPGWDPAYSWKKDARQQDAWIPFSALPWAENPPEGYIVTANQAVVDPTYRYRLTEDWEYGTRARQITDLIDGKLRNGGRISPDDMQDMQLDNTSVMARTLVPYLLRTRVGDSYVREAQDLLKDWNYHQDAGSAAAAFYNGVWRNLLLRAFGDKFPADLRAEGDCQLVEQKSDQNLPDDAVGGKPKLVQECGTREPSQAQPDGGDRWTEVVRQQLKNPDSPWWDYTDVYGRVHHGRDALLLQAMTDARQELTSKLSKDVSTWSWGRLHTLTLKEQTLGSDDSSVASGLVHRLLNRGPYELSGGSAAVDAAGWNAAAGYQVDWIPSMRMVVDLSNLDASRWINVGGASGHAFHPHYNDQTELWKDGQLLPWAFSADAVKKAAKDRLVLTRG
ncbi:penicillin acylase family protein [Streptacidiphilus sp. ASG 303]|uniref:penicillin acylase family protein n=1 Tax=Streptacidiphilus sp. ASG 303 TaxID=2896847 RepID=UPI001E4260E5|nr:penicillin acylase family protein [Streptacidiphilus sp. ASG 303]MCD0483977.1 penicillin acylase family protein [Streptacidiphilus sp. ASG 303]